MSSQPLCLQSEFQASLDCTKTLPPNQRDRLEKKTVRNWLRMFFPFALEDEGRGGSDHLQVQHSRDGSRKIGKSGGQPRLHSRTLSQNKKLRSYC